MFKEAEKTINRSGCFSEGGFLYRQFRKWQELYSANEINASCLFLNMLNYEICKRTSDDQYFVDDHTELTDDLKIFAASRKYLPEIFAQCLLTFPDFMNVSTEQQDKYYTTIKNLCFELKTYRVPVSWMSFGTIDVEALNEDQAIDLAPGPHTPMPEGTFIDGSMDIDGEVEVLQNG